MVYETLRTETINPFSITDNRLMIDHCSLEDLSGEELVNYFISSIDDTFPYKNERQNMIYNTTIFILTQSLELNLYPDRTKAFVRIYDILLPVLSNRSKHQA
ncbi:MAG: hypothetical protein JWM14_626 [Chitinophagaceae bacterium]|nr:hypothetical protein [Chitinophagaceae bacterium]